MKNLLGHFFMAEYKKYIKWVLMLLGAMRFRIYGAFLGFFIGLFIEEWLNGNFELNKKYRFQKKEVYFTTYQLKLNEMIVEVLRLSSLISRAQSIFILKYYYKRFGVERGKALYDRLKYDIKMPVNGYEAAAFLNEKIDRNQKIDILQFLYDLLLVDGSISVGERNVLENIAKAIGVLKSDFDNLFTKRKQKVYVSQPSGYTYRYYEVLGVTKTVSDTDLKKAYRKLVLKYHPDRTKINTKEAADKFQKIQDAYDKIREQRGIK
ncbi:MAG: DnaJ domain-containing protein [Chitinophagales bacterium]